MTAFFFPGRFFFARATLLPLTSRALPVDFPFTPHRERSTNPLNLFFLETTFLFAGFFPRRAFLDRRKHTPSFTSFAMTFPYDRFQRVVAFVFPKIVFSHGGPPLFIDEISTDEVRLSRNSYY